MRETLSEREKRKAEEDAMGARKFAASLIDRALFVIFCAVLTKPFCHCFCIEYHQRYALGSAIASLMLHYLLSCMRERVSVSLHVMKDGDSGNEEEDDNDM